MEQNKPETVVEMLDTHQRILEYQDEYLSAMAKRCNKNFQFLNEEILDLRKAQKRSAILFLLWGATTIYLLYNWITK